MRIKAKKKDEDSFHLFKLFDIAEFSIYDGPGIRTVIYIQGCNAQCDWYHSSTPNLDAPHSCSAPTYAFNVNDANVIASIRRILSKMADTIHHASADPHGKLHQKTDDNKCITF